MKTKTKALKREEKEATFARCLCLSLISTLVCAIGALLPITLLAAITLFFEDPVSVARHGACAVLYLVAFVCGAVSRVLCRSYTLLCGAFSGTMLFLLTLLLACIYPAGDSLAYSFALRLALPLMSVLGALAVSYERPKRRRRKR